MEWENRGQEATRRAQGPAGELSGGDREGPGRERPRELSPDRLQVLLQVLIVITGNYNFFNLLTLVLATALLDDTHLAAKSSTSRRKRTPSCECAPAPDCQPCRPPSGLALPQPPGRRPSSPAPSRP